MLETLWNSSVAWFGFGGAVVIACVAVAYFFPPLRRTALSIAAGALAILVIYGKGVSDAKRAEQKRKDDAANKLQKKYTDIDRRVDSDDDVTERMRDGKF